MNTPYKLSFYIKNINNIHVPTLIHGSIKLAPKNVEVNKLDDMLYHVTVDFDAVHKNDAIDFVNRSSNLLALNGLLASGMCVEQGAAASMFVNDVLPQKSNSKKSLKHKNKFFSGGKKPISKKQQAALKSLLSI